MNVMPLSISAVNCTKCMQLREELCHTLIYSIVCVCV